MFKIDKPQTISEALIKIKAFNKFIADAEKKGIIADQKVDIKITMKDKKELKDLADLHKEAFYEPCSVIHYYWTNITIGRVAAKFQTKDIKYKLVEIED